MPVVLGLSALGVMAAMVLGPQVSHLPQALQVPQVPPLPQQMPPMFYLPPVALPEPAPPARPRAPGERTVAQRLAEFGPGADERLRPHFREKDVAYPPERLVLVGLKHERRLEVYAGAAGDPLRFIRSYRVHAASGGSGPKLREGDRQVPEGIYPIVLLNPNSDFHLSLRIGYPNAFEREQARREGRTNLGGDIMIHGGSVSAGCLAVGDEAAEDLFVLAARTGLGNIRVLLCPADFRRGRTVPAPLPASRPLPAWTEALYEDLRRDLAALPLPPSE